jgi:hypothetical protein
MLPGRIIAKGSIVVARRRGRLLMRRDASMRVGRLWIPSVLLFTFAALSFAAAPTAAATCSLSAPSGVRVGDTLSIRGTGFPVSTTIDVSLTLDGSSPDAFTVDSTPSGTIEFSLTPEAVDEGRTTVVATAGSSCSATAVFVVVGANATLPPEPTAAPVDSGAAGTAGGGTAPRTDTPSALAPPGLPSTLWPLAALGLIIGACGLIATRRDQGR